MKAAFFSLAALAASAFAAPLDLGNDVLSPSTGGVGNAFNKVDEILTEDLGLGEIAGQVGKGSAIPAIPVKRALTDTAGLTGLLGGLLKDVTGQTDLLNGIGKKVKSGEISTEEGQKQAAVEIGNMQFKLTKVVTELTGTAGLTVLDGDVDKVLTLVVTLVTVVLKTVNSLIVILGLTPQLNSLLHSVFSLLAELLTLVTGLVVGIVPALVAALSPLLAALGNGLLAPLLTPIVAVVAGLTVGGLLPVA